QARAADGRGRHVLPAVRGEPDLPGHREADPGSLPVEAHAGRPATSSPYPSGFREKARGYDDSTVTTKTVLVVEDEAAIAEAVRARLQSEGYRVLVEGDGPTAIEITTREHPDLVVLDLMLPGMDGLEVCREIQRTSWVPVLMLTARTDEADKVAGFAVGADDYLTKPFSLRELALRVRAILRRVERIASLENGSGELSRGALTIDASKRRAVVDGDEVAL